MLTVTPCSTGFRLEMPDGTYAYLNRYEAARLHDNLRDALRTTIHAQR